MHSTPHPSSRPCSEQQHQPADACQVHRGAYHHSWRPAPNRASIRWHGRSVHSVGPLSVPLDHAVHHPMRPAPCPVQVWRSVLKPHVMLAHILHMRMWLLMLVRKQCTFMGSLPDPRPRQQMSCRHGMYTLLRLLAGLDCSQRQWAMMQACSGCQQSCPPVPCCSHAGTSARHQAPGRSGLTGRASASPAWEARMSP